MTEEMELCDTMDSISEVASNEEQKDLENQLSVYTEVHDDLGMHLMNVIKQTIDLETESDRLKSQLRNLETSVVNETNAREKKEKEFHDLKEKLIKEETISCARKRKCDEFEENIKQLKLSHDQELQEKSNSCNTLKNDNTSLSQRISKLENLINDRNAKITELELRLSSVKSTSASDLERQISELQTKLTTGQNDLLKAQSDLHKAQNDLRKLELAKQENERKLPQTSNNVRPYLLMSGPVGKFPAVKLFERQEIKKQTSEIQVVPKQTEKEEELDELKHKLKLAADTYNGLNSKYNDCKNSLDKKDDEIKHLNEKVAQQNQKLAQHKNSFDERVNSERRRMKKDAEGKLAVERAKMKQEIDEERKKMKKEMEDEGKNKKVSMWNDINKSYNEELTKSRDECTRAKNRTQLLSDLFGQKLSTLKDDLNKERKEIKGARNLVEVMANSLKQDFHQLERHLIERLAVEKTKVTNLNDCKESFDKLLPIISTVVPKAVDLIDNFKKLETKNSELQSLVDTFKNKKEEPTSDVDNDLIQRNAEALQIQLDTSNKELEYMREEMISKQISAEKLQQDLETEIKNRCALECELRDTIQQLTERAVAAESQLSQIQSFINAVPKR